MGYALANAAAKQGATVLLVSGPTTGNAVHPRVNVHSVTTAEEMLAACMEAFPDVDAVIMSAAVADFKIKKRLYSRI